MKFPTGFTANPFTKRCLHILTTTCKGTQEAPGRKAPCFAGGLGHSDEWRAGRTTGLRVWSTVGYLGSPWVMLLEGDRMEIIFLYLLLEGDGHAAGRSGVWQLAQSFLPFRQQAHADRWAGLPKLSLVTILRVVTSKQDANVWGSRGRGRVPAVMKGGSCPGEGRRGDRYLLWCRLQAS